MLNYTFTKPVVEELMVNARYRNLIPKHIEDHSTNIFKNPMVSNYPNDQGSIDRDTGPWAYSNGKIIIHRNLFDDSFDVLQKRITSKNVEISNEDEPELIGFKRGSPNSVFYHTGKDSPFYNGRTMIDNREYYVLKHFEHGSLNLSQMSALFSKIYFPYDKSTPRDLYNIEQRIDFRRSPTPTRFNLIGNEVLHLKSVKTIEISPPDLMVGASPSRRGHPWVDLWDHRCDEDFHDVEPNIYYNNTYIVPQQYDRWNGTKTLFKIYANNDDNKSVDYDLNTSDVGTLNVPGLTRNLRLQLKRPFGAQPEYLPTTDAKLVAYIDVDENTGYNYEKGTITSVDADSNTEGLLVPFNFKGNYQVTLNQLGILASFPQLELSYSSRFEKPLLDPNEGEIQLVIDNYNKGHLPYNWKVINEKNLEYIRTSNSVKPSWSALVRYSVDAQ